MFSRLCLGTKNWDGLRRKRKLKSLISINISRGNECILCCRYHYSKYLTFSGSSQFTNIHNVLRRIPGTWECHVLTGLYAVKAQTSLAPLSCLAGSRGLMRMRTNIVYFRVMRRLYRREWNWLWNWLCMNLHPWQRTRDHGVWRLTLTAYC